jgi:integrase
MPIQATKSKASAGTVQIRSSNGRLQLRFSYRGKRHCLSLGLIDTPVNRKAAGAKGKLIESDITFERLDETLAKYKPKSSPSFFIPTVIPTEPSLTLTSLWQQYFEYKALNASPKTVNGTYEPVTAHLAKCKTDGLADAVKFRMELLQVTTQSQARRTLMQLSAACDWGIKHGLITANSLAGMYTELEPTQPPPPKAFTADQRDAIIQGFDGSTHYGHYASFVKALFWTGARPCELIGLRWGSVTPDCGRIHFHESIVEVSGRLARREETKTGVKRWFTCTPKLQDMLQSIRPDTLSTDDLIFPSPNNRPIGLSNFNDRAWSKTLSGLGLLELDGQKMTVYSCRDTFITLQATAGNSSTTISRWVGNSSEVIEKRYLDRAAIEKLRPADV